MNCRLKCLLRKLKAAFPTSTWLKRAINTSFERRELYVSADGSFELLVLLQRPGASCKPWPDSPSIPTLADIIERHTTCPRNCRNWKNTHERSFYTAEVLLFGENKINTSFQGQWVASFFFSPVAQCFTACSLSLLVHFLYVLECYAIFTYSPRWAVTQEFSDKRRPRFYGSADEARVCMIVQYGVYTFCIESSEISFLQWIFRNVFSKSIRNWDF